MLARLGGDEFGVIIEDVTPAEAERVASGLHEHFQSAAFEHEGRVFPVRGSIGMAEIGERNRELKAILKAADIACYAAKGGGRNALVVHLRGRRVDGPAGRRDELAAGAREGARR